MAIIEYLDWLKRTTSEALYIKILSTVDRFIKFNRINLGKCTSQEQFIIICKRCHTDFLKRWEYD